MKNRVKDIDLPLPAILDFFRVLNFEFTQSPPGKQEAAGGGGGGEGGECTEDELECLRQVNPFASFFAVFFVIVFANVFAIFFAIVFAYVFAILI